MTSGWLSHRLHPPSPSLLLATVGRWVDALRPHALAVLACLLLAVLAGCGGGGGGTEAAATASAQAVDDPQRSIAAVAPATTALSQREAVRLADQASFGATEALISTLRSQGAAAWVAGQLATSGSRYQRGGDDAIHRPSGTDFCATRGDYCWRDHYSTEPVLWDFYRNALTQPDQLRQRVAFALGQIVVVSEHEVQGSYGYRHFHTLLLQQAFGNYRELLRRVALSPLMGEYLDHVNNDKFEPNENFARELLQLFSLGTCLLNPDGSLQGGRCQATYDNAAVRAYAYALTGWTYPAGGSSVWPCYPEGANCPYLAGDMLARPALQDEQPRMLLGGVQVPASRTPAQALDKVLDSLMNHANLPPFLSRQLIQHLVKSNPSPAYVRRVASAFASGRYLSAGRSFGSGLRGDLAATVAAVLLDTEARSSTLPAEKLREPVLMMTGLLRALYGQSDGEALGWWWGQELRQHVFLAPSVFGFYPPDFPVAGTSLVGPAFGIHNANTAFARLNFINHLLFYGGVDPSASVPGALGTRVDLTRFTADANDAGKLVDRLLAVATGGRISTAARTRIVAAVNAWPADDGWGDWRADRVRTAAYLVFAAPAYQVLQ